jgi:hypothetical protein
MNIRQPLKQHASFLKLAGAILALFSLAACLTPAVLLHALQTAAAEGKQIASTQLPAIQQTAELSVTEIGPPPQLPEFSLATLMAEAASDHPNVEVQVARDRLKKVEAMQSPWNQVDAPIKSAPGQRSASSYANVIDQFDVKAAAFAGRYVAGGADSSEARDGVFAGDVMRAMGVPLPTKGNLGKGKTGATYTDPETAPEWLLNDYLIKSIRWVTSATDQGVESDWVQVDATKPEGLRRVVDHVNAGTPTAPTPTTSP